jgi:hypothetical protein
MSNKGQNGGIGALLGFFLGWIGVIVGCCMRNLKDEERRHRETLSVMSSQRDSVSSPPSLPLLSSSVPDFRLEAIRNLKAAGKSFDDYDIEIEIKHLRSKHLKAESLRRANLERERSLGVVSSSGVEPPPLPSSVPLSSPPPLPGEFAVSPLADRDEPDFRIEAIRKLKSIGQPFDEYDIELEMENLRSAYLAELEVSRAKELEFLRAKERVASEFLRVKEEAEAVLRAKEASLRAEREAQEAIERKATARAERRQFLTVALVMILVIALMTILSLISTG